ncbi:MAG: peptidoglycan-binding domain-containing protein [Candidatus Paceibacterota bacterium]
MENFKFGLISIIVIAALGLLGYWAFTTLEPGDLHAARQHERELAEKNSELEKELAALKSQLGTLEAEKEEVKEEPAPAPEEEKPAPTTITYKNQTLINELQKLVTDNVFMKVGSKGTRVGTIQKFLNLYNKTSNKVDNDYGAGLKTAVTDFQKDVGTTADGETGPATYKKMIEWLKKQ